MTARISPFRDSTQTFDFYADAHRAALVTLARSGLLDAVQAGQIARALVQVIADHEAPGSAASNDYLDLETRLIDRIGATASALHLGRSRQDLLSAANRHTLREGILAVMRELADARQALLGLAERHRATIVPRYTHGVPAQPTTFGHYLLAFAEALAQVDDDLARAYEVVNRSPLGASVLATSRFPVDRRGLAALLGFEGIVENSYGANHVAPVAAIHAALSPLVALALHVSAFAQDVSAELPAPSPWLAIADPALTGESSAMPQKRNPLVLEHLRETAAVVLGAAHTFTLLAHNVPSGMTDSRDRVDLFPVTAACDLLTSFTATLHALELDAVEAERRAATDYSTMTDLADVLYESHGVPFRLGHGVASRLSDVGREAGLAPADIPLASVLAVAHEVTGAEISLDADELQRALSPAEFIRSRRGEGGPSEGEMTRMLAAHRGLLATHTARLAAIDDARRTAADRLHTDFAALLGGDTDTPTPERTPDGTPL